ncbi:MAG: HAD family hydrolase [Candidatus Woesearchaeota archaeon]
MNSPIETVVFDCYGTLAYIDRQETVWKQVLRHLGQHSKGSLRQQILQTSYTNPHSFYTIIQQGIEDLPHTQRKKLIACLPEEKLVAFQKQMHAENYQVRLYSDVGPVLYKLAQKGYRVLVVSNASHEYTDRVTKLLGEHMPTKDIHFSCNLGYAKPDIRIFEQAFTRSGIPLQYPNILAVGDSLHNDVLPLVFQGKTPGTPQDDTDKPYNSDHNRQRKQQGAMGLHITRHPTTHLIDGMTLEEKLKLIVRL